MAATVSGDSCTEAAVLWCARLEGMRVGSRDGVGDVFCRALRSRGGTAEAVVVPRAVVAFARRGILFADGPDVFAGFVLSDNVEGPPRRAAAAAVEDRVIRAGFCSDTATREPACRADAGFAFILRIG